MNTTREVIDHWTARMLGNPEEVKKIGAIYKFVIEGHEGGTWVFQCREPMRVAEENGEAECTLTLSTEDFVAIGNGRLNPQTAFLMGKIKISGEPELALKLHRLIS